MAGALTLVPENGNRLWRMSTLAALAVEQPSRDGKWLKSTKVDSLVNAGALAEFGAQKDDPPEDVLAEELVFHGKAYRVGSGPSENGVWALRTLSRALLLSDALPVDVRGPLIELLGAGLSLSDSVLTAASVTIFELPPPGKEPGIVVPPGNSLQKLVDLVTFSPESLATATGPWDEETLCHLTLTPGSRKVTEHDAAEGALDAWPLIAEGERIVLSQPLAIVGALRHRLLVTAIEAIGTEAVAAAWRDAAHADVVHNLGRLGISTTKDADTSDGNLTLRASLDSDVDLVCIVLMDDMKGVDPEQIYGMYDSRAALDLAHAQFAREQKTSGRTTVGLLIAAAAGRGAYMAVRSGDSRELTVVIFAAPDFEAFAMMELDEPRALWRFARALASLRDGPQVTSFSVLDTYALYLEHERSFDELLEATHLMVPPGAGAGPRAQAKRRRWRTGLRYVDGTVREVERRGGGDDDPFWFPFEIVDPRPLIAAAIVPLPIWVRGWRGADRRAWSVLETVCYWLWQLSETHPEVYVNGRGVQALRVDVGLQGGRAWFEDRASPVAGEAAGTFGSVQVVSEGFVLELDRRAWPLLAAPDNEGERELLRLLLSGLQQWSGQSIETERIVETIAPLGPKKHLLILSQHANPLMDRDSTGPLPTLVEDSLSAARKTLAKRLSKRFGFHNELVPGDRTEEVARGAVEELLAEIETRVAELSNTGALEILLERTETLIAEGQYVRATLPARDATFTGLASRMAFRDDLVTVNQAAVCTRFVTEYICAIPPEGSAVPSEWRIDDLVALVAEMLDWAYFGDAAHWGLNATGLLVRDDGQLRLQELGSYERGRLAFFERQVDAEREQSAASFESLFTVPDDNPVDVPALVQRVDGLFSDEAGATFLEVGELLAAAHWIARGADTNVVARPLEDAVAELASATGWPAAKVEKTIAWLALSPRAKFLKPPGGGWQDVVPSRFTRAWSINRRPFTRRTAPDGTSEILWGRRQVLVTSMLLYSQLRDGRIAKLVASKPLLQELGRIADESGHNFEEQIAGLFKDEPEFKTAAGLTRLGPDQLKRPNGDTLGDIDVLIAHLPTKTLWAAECKDLGSARTPSEVVDDLTSHFEIAHKSSASKHDERVDWLKARIPLALAKLDIAGKAGWSARGVFVVSNLSEAGYIKKLPFPVVLDLELVEFARGTSQSTNRERRK